MDINTLKQELKDLDLKITDLSRKITPLLVEKNQLNLKRRQLEKQIEKLELEQLNNEFAEKYILKHNTKHSKYKYIGKTDGKCDNYLVNNVYIQCKKCNVFFELFSTNTGIGNVVKGVCPTCEYELNFTNYERW